jgi:hypothetical protein
MPITASVRSFAETTSITGLAMEDLSSPKLRLGWDYWRMLRGTRRFPTRDEIKPRDIATILSHMVLVKVVDGGADFQFRIVGDHAGRGYSVPFTNRLLSDIATELPRASANWSNLCRQVVASATPFAVRVVIGLDAPEANFTEAEGLFLPLGPADGKVDHIMNFVEHVLKSPYAV